jgi:murein DD-endopeptidase MepM/ murein hydrolase activator NlpD
MRLTRGRCEIVGFALILSLAASGKSAAQHSGQPRPVGTSTVTAADVAASHEVTRSWLYGHDLGDADNSSTLFRVESGWAGVGTHGDAFVVGETTIDKISDIAFTPDGALYGINIVGQLTTERSQFLRIDPVSGAAVVVNADMGVTGNALASDPRGQLYMMSSRSRELYTVDEATGVPTLVGGLATAFFSSGDLAFTQDGRLFGTFLRQFNNDFLVSIDPSTGVATPIGTDLGFPEVYGLAFGPPGSIGCAPGCTPLPTRGLLYGVATGSSSPQLIAIDTSSGLATALGAISSAPSMGGFAPYVKTSPLEGQLQVATTLGNPGGCNDIPELWTFCQHRTGAHAAGGGIGGSDDTFAWDINLLAGGNADADAGRDVRPVAPGIVVEYAGAEPPGGASGAVLLEHTVGDYKWWSGYLHMSPVNVTTGQSVGPDTVLGKIGSAGAPNNHLHLVIYEGANAPGQLQSVDATFFERTVTAYVLDAFGVIHPGNGAAPFSPAPPYWGWDIARDFEVSPGGVFVLDGFGGVHAAGGASPPSPAPPYFGFDIAQDIEVASDGLYVLDGFGGLHAFDGASVINPAPPYFGFNVARDMELAATGLYVLDGFGGLHPAGGAATLSPGPPYFGFDIARDIELSGSGLYMLDGFGGVHAVGGAPTPGSGVPYFGFDAAVDMELTETGFYVLDAFGAVHAAGGASPVYLPTPYFGFDAARDLEISR